MKIGIDGVPLSKNPDLHLWPILAAVYPDGEVFVIGCYHGPSQLNSAKQYLKQFVDDMISFEYNGITVYDRTYYGEIFIIICDIPAKSFILETIGHAGYHSCFKCKVKEEHLNRKVCFPDTGCAKRTDAEMRKDNFQDTDQDLRDENR